MEAKFSPRVKDVITYSREEALRLGHDYIGTEHLLLRLLRGENSLASNVLRKLGITYQVAAKEIGSNCQLDYAAVIEINQKDLLPFSHQLTRLTDKARLVLHAADFLRSDGNGSTIQSITPEHILLGLIYVPDSTVHKTVFKTLIKPTDVERKLLK